MTMSRAFDKLRPNGVRVVPFVVSPSNHPDVSACFGTNASNLRLGTLGAVERIQDFRDSGFQFAVPHREYLPAKALQRAKVRFVAIHVALNLGSPVVCIGNRPPEATALMPVPQTAVDENDGREPGQHDIRFSGQIFPVKTKPESGGVERFSDRDLGRRVLRVHARHDSASRLWRKLVRHVYASSDACSNR